MYGKRRGTDREVAVTFTIEDARRAGLLDEWVERRVEDGKWPDGNKKYRVEKYVIGTTADPPEWAAKEVLEGRVKRKENWKLWPADMLAARAAKRVCRIVAGDVMFGLAAALEPGETVPPEHRAVEHTHGHRPADGDHDIVDAELVEDAAGETGGGDLPTARPDLRPTTEGNLAGDRFAKDFAVACREAGMSDEERHAAIHFATHGRVASAKEVEKGEVPEIRRVFRGLTQPEPTLRFMDAEEGGGVIVVPAEAS
jgi:hypothetical protein